LMFAKMSLALQILKEVPAVPSVCHRLYPIRGEARGEFCVAINTTICMGFCYSRDSNMREYLDHGFLVQRGCTYDKANPTFTYPVALSCHCGACRTERTSCAHRASMDGARCTKPFRDLSLFSGQSNYMISF
uniref:Thyrotropin subunit beta n=1 Tax=Takifugu rubripes TaxID=31033 RepID=H2VBS5_TAKRU